MKEIYFNNREGETVLSPNEKNGLLLKHVSQISELNELEQMNINKGLMWLESYKGEILNERFLRKLHKKLFGEVWKWAGKYRHSEKNIGIEAWRVPSETKKLCDDCQYWVDHGSYPWPELIARFHHRLVYIHPFPNGNGRFARLLTNFLCFRHNKKAPSWKSHLKAELRRDVYIEALREADLKKFDKLIAYFENDNE